MGVKKRKFVLTCHFSLNQTSCFYEEFLFSIFFGLYITTTFPCDLHKMIDPIDPRSHPQGVPQFQAQYIKLNTPCTIPILIILTYMVANEVLKDIFWVEDVQRPIRPKNWPKKGQNFWNQKIFNFSHKIIGSHDLVTTFYYWHFSWNLFLNFWPFGPKKAKNSKSKIEENVNNEK